MKFNRFILFTTIFAAIAKWSCISLFGCGLEWRVPTNYFDGVDPLGYVEYASKIGEIDLGDGLKIPLIIDFTSNREDVSPYVGRGWIVALLESRIVQTSENGFLLTQPDGWFRKFRRAKSSDMVLNGQGGWKATINGSVIEAYAQCGWKLTYTRGRISAISTPTNRRLDFIYQSNKVKEIRENGATRLAVAFDLDKRARQEFALMINISKYIQHRGPMSKALQVRIL